MVFIHINKPNSRDFSRDFSRDLINVNKMYFDKLDTYLQRDDTKVFILFYMEGCRPCNATRPEWKKIENVLHRNFANRDDVVIVDVDTDLAENIKSLKNLPGSFPTMRFITHKGNTVENYEDSKINSKNRTIDSFIEWIKLKTGEANISKSEAVKPYSQKTNRHKTNKHNTNRHKSNKHNTNKNKSNKHEANRHKSNKHEANKHTSNKHTSNKHTSNKHTNRRKHKKA